MEESLNTKEAMQLYSAFLTLKSPQEVRVFLRDVCTLSEIKAMIERFQVAKLLKKNTYSYRQISKKTGSSTATVTRVAHWLHHGMGGYNLVLERIK